MAESKNAPIGRIKLQNVRISWPQVFEQGEINGEASGFSVACIVEPGSPGQKQIEAAMMAVAKQKWADKAPAMLKRLKAEGKLCIQYHNPDAPSEDPAFQDAHRFNCRSKVRPVAVGRDGSTPVTSEDGLIFGGSYANVIADLWAQDNSWGKRINAKFKLIQHVREGEPFSGDVPVDLESEVDDLTDGVNDDAPGLDGDGLEDFMGDG